MQSAYQSIGTIVQTGISYIPIIGPIIGGLISIFTGGTDLSGINRAIGDLANKTAAALDQLKRFAWTIGRFALGILLALYRILGDIIGSLIKAFKRLLDALQKIYEDVIKPMLRVLRDLRKLMADVYNRYLRPIINIIQRIRQFLAIFEIFGFQWARSLDARLARIEGKIIGPYLWFLRQINGYGRWINIILTATGVIQRGPFLNSLYRYSGQLVNLWWVTQSGQLTGVQAPAPVTPETAPTLAQVESDFSLFAHFGTGPYQFDADQARATFITSLPLL